MTKQTAVNTNQTEKKNEVNLAVRLLINLHNLHSKKKWLIRNGPENGGNKMAPEGDREGKQVYIYVNIFTLKVTE